MLVRYKTPKTSRLTSCTLRHALLLIGLVLLLLPPASAQTPAQPSEPAGDRTEESPTTDDKENRDDKKAKIKPYDEVITAEAETSEGVFRVHRLDDKLYYEIPREELDTQFLLVSRISKTAAGLGYGGQKLSTRIVRWEKRQNQIFLREVSYQLVADSESPVARAVGAANYDPILQAFDIAAVRKEGDEELAFVIEVTPLFATEVSELSARSRIGARGFDKKRSYVERAVAFPDNIEVRAIHTYTSPPDSGDDRRRDEGPRRRPSMDQSSATLELAFSMVRLPEEPMQPRLFDERVGYFSVSQVDYGTDEHRAAERRYITRWRLEKKDPQAEISEPKKPIVYWVDPATPAKWVPYVKQGVEDWQPAFEAAGFRNAIIAKEAPSPDEDPDWSAEDSRYSVIRWLPSEIENASGPHVHDPRTGEILESDIQFYHNVQNLVRDWYFVQVGALDPRAQELPFPDELMGELLRYVVAHEVGHTLGFQHNMKASSTYPFDKLRDPEWLATMRHTPTLMDYSRFNYVVQPEDGVAVENLIPNIGPYDKWATMWGYKPIPEASSAEEERPTLDAWARQQDATPWLRFSTAGSRGSDPGELTEAVGDANAVEATRLGVKNLERVTDLLLPTAEQEGRNWDELEELYGRVLGQWIREMNHVAAIVGGHDSRQVHAGQEGLRFAAISRERQQAAVEFLNDYAFETPSFLVRPEILRRIEPQGIGSRLATAQRAVLDFLLRPDRFARLVEQEALDPESAYAPLTFLDDLRSGIWSELVAKKVTVDSFRRQTQRIYLEVADERLNGREPAADDMRAFLRGQLVDLRDQARASAAKATDDATRFHLDDVAREIGDILEPSLPRRTSEAPSGRRAVVDAFDPTVDHGCWVDVSP